MLYVTDCIVCSLLVSDGEILKVVVVVVVIVAAAVAAAAGAD